MRPPLTLLSLILLILLIPVAHSPPLKSPEPESGLLALPAPNSASDPGPSPSPLSPSSPSPESSTLPVVYGSQEPEPEPPPGPVRSVLSAGTDENGRFLGVSFDGTLYLVNTTSGEKQWGVSTGFPLWHIELANSYNSGSDYSIFPGEDGSFYEISKDGVKRKLNLTIEDLVDFTPHILGAVLTVGSKTMTVYNVDAESGELLPEDYMQGTQKAIAAHTSASCTYTVIHIKYSLKSSVLGKFLWSYHTSKFTAFKTCKWTNSLGFSQPYQSEVTVEYLSEDRMFPLVSSVQNSRTFEQKSSAVRQLPQISSELSELENSFSAGSSLIGQNASERSPFFEHQIKSAQIHNSQDGNFMSSIHHAKKTADAKPSVDVPLRNLTSQVSRMLPSDKRGEKLHGSHAIEGYEHSFTFACKEAICEPEPATSDNLTGALGPHSTIPNEIGILHAPQISSRGTFAERHFHKMFSISVFGILFWCFFSCLIILLAYCYLKPRESIHSDNQINTGGQRAVLPKKRRPRRAGNIKNGSSLSSNNLFKSSEKGNAQTDLDPNMQSNERLPFINFTGGGASDGRWVGRLYVSNTEIGRGSNGTVVFEGVYDGRVVAVKRLLRAHHDVASKEIQNLIASDRHPNIVRWYGAEQDLDFIYIALELCTCSLSDLVQLCSGSSTHQNVAENPTLSSMSNLECVKGIDGNLDLWRENGFPSPQLLKLMRDVVYGLAHLHEIGIIHRDLKPQNVLISNGRSLDAKLSDMGISKQLLEDMSSLSHHATGYGSSGWQAPEQLLHGRHTRAVDMFSLGCIIFFCLTKGKHPFGNYFERDSNILSNHVDLFLVDHIPEAMNLLPQLLDADPKMRPTALQVLADPFFWSSETCLSFLRDTSDRIELEDKENQSELLKELENIASEAFGGKWGEKLDARFITDMGRYRKYSFVSTRDLLRVIRNKFSHYRELPKELQEILGPVPEGFYRYFSSRFPKLLMEVYKVVYIHCREEDGFKKYFTSSLV